MHGSRAAHAIIALVSLAVAACATGSRSPQPSPAPVPQESTRWMDPAAEIPVEQGTILPYLVRRGWLELTAASPATTAARAQTVTTQLGGLVQNARVGDERADLVLRVPEPRLDEALDALSTLGKVESRRLSADDVTEEVIDLEARVASLVGIRDRLRGMLDAAASMSDVMTIERELARVQAEIDAIEGRLRHLRSRATMAELSLSVRREHKLGPVSRLIVALGSAVEWLF